MGWVKCNKFLLVCFLNILCFAEPNVVFLVPFAGCERAFLNSDEGNYWYQLKLACKDAGYELTTNRNVDPDKVVAVVGFNMPSEESLALFPNAKKILYTWEPPIIDPANFNSTLHERFDLVATWDDSLIDEKKYHKFNYALGFSFPSDPIPFSEKKLCCAFIGQKHSGLANELYSKRLETVRFFEEMAPEDFNFFGTGWSLDYKTYRGYAQNKVVTAKEYKFAIVYENTSNIQGYITEKIFDAFSAGCIPVYWGASNVAEFIPQECFIPREQFATNSDLYAFLKEMTEEQYNQYLEAISNFLSSEKAYQFSQKKYLSTFVELLKIALDTDHTRSL